MFNRILYKAEAKALLKGHWKQPVLVTLILYVLLVVFYIVMWNILAKLMMFSLYYPAVPVPMNTAWVILITSVIFGLLFSVISLAYTGFFFAFDKDQSVSFKTFLNCFSYKGITAALWTLLWLFLWSIPLIAGAIVFFGASVTAEVYGAEIPLSTTVLIIAGMIVYLGGFIILYAKAMSYSMTLYVLAENPGISVRKAMRISIAMTKGSRENVFVMALSFYGWMILAFIPAGLGLLWLMPYMSAAFINAYKALKENALKTNVLNEADFGPSEDVKQLPENTQPDNSGM